MKSFHLPELLLTGACLSLPAEAAIRSIPEPPPASFKAQTIDDNIQIGYGLAIGDVDGDGKKDIILADKNQFVWYRNPDWEKFILTDALTERDHVCLAARDIDGDGKVEIAVGAGWNPGNTVDSGAVFYLSPPEDRTQKWTPVQLPNEPTTHRMQWVQDPDNQFFLAVLPLHPRTTSSGEEADGVKFLGYRPPDNPAEEEWTTFVINDTMHGTHNFDLVRWDGEDYIEEILIAGREGVQIAQRTRTGWQSEGVTTNVASEVRSGQLPSTRRFIATIEPFHGNEVVVNTHSRTLVGRLFWTGNRVVLDDDLIQGHALATADLLGVGYDQIVAGWRNVPGVAVNTGAPLNVGIRLYIPLDKRGYTWERHAVIDDGNMACEDLQVADLNDDGKPDLVASGRATQNVIIYWNQTEFPE